MSAVAFEHLVVHQFDPAEEIAGGVHGFIGDFIRFAPPGHEFRVVGVDGTGRWRRWRWQDAEIGGRAVSFLPLASFSAGRQQRLVPHTLRLAAGLLARRPASRGAFVHAHRAETGAMLALSYPRSPLIQFVHTDSAEGLRHRTETFWRFLPGTHLGIERFAASRAARTWVLNATAAERLSAVSANVRAARNWYDDRLFYPETSPEPRPLTVGWVGRMEPPKDPVKAVDTLGELARSGVAFEAWFAGSGTLERQVERRIAELRIGDSVTRCGTLAPARLAEQLRKTDVLLVSSLWEGQPRAVLEALGSGVPVVSTPVGDVPDILVEGKAGFIAKDATSSTLAGHIVRAAELRDRQAIAATIGAYRATEVVGSYFSDLEALAGTHDGA